MHEENAEIPMLVFSPTIINHGRKLIISPMNVSYFTHHSNNIVTSDGEVEFTRFFAKQNAVNLKFSTALRMSATFPYVMPMVSLPTSPTVEVMDAGIRDNYGISLAVKFLSEFKVWIQNNTSGVILITTRDRPRELKETRVNNSVYTKMSKPAWNVVDNIFYTQDFENDQLLDDFINNSGLNITNIDFCLPNDPKTKISLSWHLTKLEKLLVIGSLEEERNEASFKTFLRNIP
jgi:hypothetical protein